MNPNDLNGFDGPSIIMLFGDDPQENPWWTLERADERSFEWNDKYLGVKWRVTHGYIVALHEVSTEEQAAEFARKNRIHLFSDGGLFLKGQGVAELFIRTDGLLPREEVKTEHDLYRLKFQSGAAAKIGYGSMLFRRLVAAPAAEKSPNFPDPTVLQTLVISGIEREEVQSFADLALFHFRKLFRGISSSFWPISDLHLAPPFRENGDPADEPTLRENLRNATRPEAIAFFNRAKESGVIPGFLYFYRVVESCFDIVIDQEVQKWRSDTALDCLNILKKFRKIQTEREDKWALRAVLSEILDQPLLENATSLGLILTADADSLTEAIYSRRNGIAHGRRLLRGDLLIPYGFSLGDIGQSDRNWYNLMEILATRSLERWILLED